MQMAKSKRQKQFKNIKMSNFNFKESTVYKKAFSLAMEIFEISISFPKEEKYSLTDQVRRSSRSVCANLAEAYRKKRYPAHFISKLTDCDAENSETNVWIDFALACNYIDEQISNSLRTKSEEVGKLLNHMINNPDKY
jgi:four helix bundle protein